VREPAKLKRDLNILRPVQEGKYRLNPVRLGAQLGLNHVLRLHDLDGNFIASACELIALREIGKLSYHHRNTSRP
jgi:hypothetical protein